jgi:hypothetical protein
MPKSILRLATLAILCATLPAFSTADDSGAADPASAQPDDGLLTLSATVLMPDGSPAAGAIVEALNPFPNPRNVRHADESGRVVLRDVFGNGAGKFRFTGIPANTPLRLITKNEEGLPAYSLDEDILLTPAEVRENEKLQARRRDAAGKLIRVP